MKRYVAFRAGGGMRLISEMKQQAGCHTFVKTTATTQLQTAMAMPQSLADVSSTA